MTMRAISAFLLLGVLALAQFAVLTVPAALVLADRPGAAWMELWTHATAGTVVLCNAVAVCAAVLLGTPAAAMLWRGRGQGVTAAVLLAPLLLPAALLAGGETTLEGQAVLLAGHASLGIAFGTGCGLVALLGVDRALLLASASAGVSPFGTWRRVVLPLMAPGVLAGVLLGGASSMVMSVVALARGKPAAFTALAAMGAPPILAIAGVAMLLCAVVMAALTLLRR